MAAIEAAGGLPAIIAAITGLVIALTGLWGAVRRNSPENVRELKRQLAVVTRENEENKQALLVVNRRLFQVQMIAAQHGWIDPATIADPEHVPALPSAPHVDRDDVDDAEVVD